MSFIELAGIDEVHEPQVVPEGLYDLIIDGVPIEKPAKDGKGPNLLCIIKILGVEDAANVLHNVSLPGPEDDAEKRKFKILMLKRFCHVFGIQCDSGGFNTEDFAGAQGSCNLTQEEYNNVMSNKLVLPQLPQGA